MSLVHICFLIVCQLWNQFTGSLFKFASFSNSVPLPINVFPPEKLRIYFPCISSTQANRVPFIWFTLFVCSQGKYSMLTLVLFQLLCLLSITHSLNMLSHQIALLISVTIRKLTFSDLLIPPRCPLYPIMCWSIVHHTLTMRLPNPCIRCATELDCFEDIGAIDGCCCRCWWCCYWCCCCFVVIVVLIIIISELVSGIANYDTLLLRFIRFLSWTMVYSHQHDCPMTSYMFCW